MEFHKELLEIDECEQETGMSEYGSIVEKEGEMKAKAIDRLKYGSTHRFDGMHSPLALSRTTSIIEDKDARSFEDIEDVRAVLFELQ